MWHKSSLISIANYSSPLLCCDGSVKILSLFIVFMHCKGKKWIGNGLVLGPFKLDHLNTMIIILN